MTLLAAVYELGLRRGSLHETGPPGGMVCANGHAATESNDRLAIVVGALTLPAAQLTPVLMPVAFLVIAAGVMMEIAYRRMTRKGRIA